MPAGCAQGRARREDDGEGSWCLPECPRLVDAPPRLGGGRPAVSHSCGVVPGPRSARSGSLEGLPEALPPLYLLRLFSASGDIRTNGDKYLYEIQLSSIANSKHPACTGANICQVKPNDQHFSRKVGTPEKTKYYIQGNPSLRRCDMFKFLEGRVLTPMTSPAVQSAGAVYSQSRGLTLPDVPWAERAEQPGSWGCLCGRVCLTHSSALWLWPPGELGEG